MFPQRQHNQTYYHVSLYVRIKTPKRKLRGFFMPQRQKGFKGVAEVVREFMITEPQIPPNKKSRERHLKGNLHKKSPALGGAF